MVRLVLLILSVFFGLLGERELVAQENRLTLYLRDGSTIGVQPQADAIQWSPVSNSLAAGKIQTIPWSQIDTLILAETTPGDQVQSILALVEQLSSNDYLKREAAEEMLSTNEFAAPFRELIEEQASQSTDPETVYRLSRILHQIVESEDAFGDRFDELRLSNGKILSGDATRFAISGTFLGDRIELDRKQLARISTREAARGAIEPQPIRVNVFNRPNPLFYGDGDIVIGFEADERSDEVAIGENINQRYVDRGLVMDIEGDGYVQTIKYAFKFCPRECGKRSACPFDAVKGEKLRSTTRIEFCPPGLPGVVAGVKKFALILERIDHSRDCVVEAYNRRGQLLGVVEATDRLCVFAGFACSDLITQIRITRNEHLVVNRRVDETYAFDEVTFDAPLVINGLVRPINTGEGPGIVELADGDMLAGPNFKLDDAEISFDNPVSHRQSNVPWKNVRLLGRSAKLKTADLVDHHWRVLLADGSIVKCERNSPWSAFDFVGHTFAENQVVGVWKGKCRIAEEEDYLPGRPVVVFPEGRIITQDFRWNQNGYQWNPVSSQTRIREVRLGDDLESGHTDSTYDGPLVPEVDRVDFSGSQTAPTLWLSQPVSERGDQAHLRLNDGQYFVLSDNSGFRIDKIDDRAFYVSFHGKSKTYPLSRVISYRLLQPTDRSQGLE